MPSLNLRGLNGCNLPGTDFRISGLIIGPIVVPFGGSYLEFYKVIPKRNYYGAYG